MVEGRELNNFSVQIGSLLSESREATRQRVAMFKKLDIINDKQIELRGAISVLTDQHLAIKKHIDENIMPTIDDYKALKNQGIGVLGIIAILGGTAAIGISKLLNILINPPLQ